MRQTEEKPLFSEAGTNLTLGGPGPEMPCSLTLLLTARKVPCLDLVVAILEQLPTVAATQHPSHTG